MVSNLLQMKYGNKNKRTNKKQANKQTNKQKNTTTKKKAK
jgi:hypothetical protein